MNYAFTGKKNSSEHSSKQKEFLRPSIVFFFEQQQTLAEMKFKLLLVISILQVVGSIATPSSISGTTTLPLTNLLITF
jgi:hypothetical protein